MGVYWEWIPIMTFTTKCTANTVNASAYSPRPNCCYHIPPIRKLITTGANFASTKQITIDGSLKRNEMTFDEVWTMGGTHVSKVGHVQRDSLYASPSDGVDIIALNTFSTQGTPYCDKHCLYIKYFCEWVVSDLIEIHQGALVKTTENLVLDM